MRLRSFTIIQSRRDLPRLGWRSADPPRRLVLFASPPSGDGAATRAGVAERARESGTEVIVLAPGQDLASLAPPVGGDGSPAAVAAVAVTREIPFVRAPAGTHNHFALDVGIDRHDVPGALDALQRGGRAPDRRREVNGRIFLNNVSLGINGDPVRQPACRDAKVRTIRETAQEVPGHAPRHHRSIMAGRGHDDHDPSGAPDGSRREHERSASPHHVLGKQPAASDDQRPSPMSQLMDAAASHGVPLRTIVAAVAVVAATGLLGILAYRLRGVLLLILAGSFVAAILDPIVVGVQRWMPRRGLAVTVVVAWSVLVFAGLAVAFGFPLASGLSRFARGLPSYVHLAQQGRGWLGHLLARFHIQAWARHNVPKLRNVGRELTGPAVKLGKGAASLLFDLFTILALTFLFLLEGPKLRSGFLSLMARAKAERYARVMREMSRTVSGYMLGNLLTSLIAGLVVLVTLLALGVPYPFLWGLWVALVDFLPVIGGALAGIPTVLFALVHSLTAGIVTLVVFVVYTQVENHFLNPMVMSRTVRINPLLVLVSVLVAGAIGNWLGGAFGAFVAALFAIPTAASLQIAVREIWQAAPTGQARPARAPRDAPTDSS